MQQTHYEKEGGFYNAPEEGTHILNEEILPRSNPNKVPESGPKVSANGVKYSLNE